MTAADDTAAFFDALAPGFDELCRGDTLEIAEICALLAGGRGRVLDVGMGTGRIAIALAHLGWQVDGVDVSAGMLAQARSNAARAGVGQRMQFLLGNALEPGVVPPRRYEAVVSIGCLFHVPPAKHQQFLSNLAVRVAPGGVLLVDVETGLSGGWPAREQRTFSAGNVGESLRLEIRSVCDEARREQRGHFAFQWPTGRIERHKLTASWASTSELRAMIEAAGLRVLFIKEGWGRSGGERPSNALALAVR